MPNLSFNNILPVFLLKRVKIETIVLFDWALWTLFFYIYNVTMILFNRLWKISAPFTDFINIWPNDWVKFLYFWTKINKVGHSAMEGVYIQQQFESVIGWTNTILSVNRFSVLQVKIWFQNHRYKYKRQAKEKAMSESSPNSQVRINVL